MFSKFGIVMVVASDIDKSVAFYRDVLGLQLQFSSPHWAQFDVGGVTLGLHPATEHTPVCPGGTSFGFCVDDIEATLADLKSKGANVVYRATESFGELAIIADPDGYGVQIGQRKAGGW